jgi:hypothetical protein
MRNLVMHHADTRTFLKFYLSRRISKNLPAIIRGLDPEDDIMRAACRMSRTIDPNRPQRLTTEQSFSLNHLTVVKKLIRQRDEIVRSFQGPPSKHKGTPRHEAYRKLNQELAGTKKREYDKLLKEVQEIYDREQPMLEIKRQLSGIGQQDSSPKPLKCSNDVPLPQQRLINSLLSLPRSTIEEEMLRRTEAINAVAEYSQFQEGDTCRLPREKRPKDSSENSQLKNETPDTIDQQECPLESAIRSAMKDHRPLFCFICLGQPNLDVPKRTQKFASHGDVTKHIRVKHLKKIVSSNPIECKLCGEEFAEIMHLQRHASDFHSTVTGSLWQNISV